MIYKAEEVSIDNSSWGWAVAHGTLLILLGIALAIYPIVSIVVGFSFVGIYWFVSGAVTVYFGIKGAKEERTRLVIAGLVSIVASIVVLVAPLIATAFAVSFTMILLGITSIIFGITVLIGPNETSDESTQESSGGNNVLGISNIVIGFILVASPMVTAISLAIFAGVFAVMGGAWLLYMGLKIRIQGPATRSKLEAVQAEDK